MSWNTIKQSEGFFGEVKVTCTDALTPTSSSSCSLVLYLCNSHTHTNTHAHAHTQIKKCIYSIKKEQWIKVHLILYYILLKTLIWMSPCLQYLSRFSHFSDWEVRNGWMFRWGTSSNWKTTSLSRWEKGSFQRSNCNHNHSSQLDYIWWFRPVLG